MFRTSGRSAGSGAGSDAAGQSDAGSQALLPHQSYL
jgi:hypothetical protein